MVGPLDPCIYDSVPHNIVLHDCVPHGFKFHMINRVHFIKDIHERFQKNYIQLSDTRALLALQEGINLKYMVTYLKYSDNITVFHDQCVTVDSAFGTYINQIIRVMYLDQTLRYFASIVLCKTDTFLHSPVCASAIL